MSQQTRINPWDVIDPGNVARPIRAGLVSQGAVNASGTQDIGYSLSFIQQATDDATLAVRAVPSVVTGLQLLSSTGSQLMIASAGQSPNGEIWVKSSLQGSNLTASAPANYTSTGASAQGVAANALRRKLLIINNDPANSAWLGFSSNAAVVNKGILLAPYGSYSMSEADGNLDTSAVNVIDNGSHAILSVQEWT